MGDKRENRASGSRRSRSTPSTRGSVHTHTPIFPRCHAPGTPTVRPPRISESELLEPRLRSGIRIGRQEPGTPGVYEMFFNFQDTFNSMLETLPAFEVLPDSREFTYLNELLDQ